MPFWNFKFSLPDRLSAIADAKKAPHAERQRGLWNFLTWSFYLATFLTATEIHSGSAHAAAANTDSHDAAHPDSDGTQFSIPTHPELSNAALESAPPSPALPESESRLALNLISPNALPDASAIQTSSSLEGSASHAGSASPGIVFGNPFAEDGHDLSNLSSNHDGLLSSDIIQPVTEVIHDVTTVLGDVVSAATGTVETIVQDAMHTIDALTSDVGHVVGDVASTLGDAVGGPLHAVTAVASDVGDTVLHVGSGIGDVLDTALNSTSSLVHDLTHASGFAQGSGSADFDHSAMGDLGIGSPGSLTFALETHGPEMSSGTASPTAGYSQYNLSVQDAVMSEVQSSHSVDSGSISSIITSALGIGQHHTTSDTDPHSGDQQSGHILHVDDPTQNLHHVLFG